jgi:hypothetical protein
MKITAEKISVIGMVLFFNIFDWKVIFIIFPKKTKKVSDFLQNIFALKNIMIQLFIFFPVIGVGEGYVRNKKGKCF